MKHRKREYYPTFKDALNIARSLSVKTRWQWRKLVSEGLIPDHIPAHPDGIYKKHGWRGWRHWLGTEFRMEEEKHGNPETFAEISKRLKESKRSKGAVWPGPNYHHHPYL